MGRLAQHVASAARRRHPESVLLLTASATSRSSTDSSLT